MQRGLKIVLDRRLIEKNAGAVAAIKSRLKPGGKGEIRLVLPLADRGKELEFVFPGATTSRPRSPACLRRSPALPKF